MREPGPSILAEFHRRSGGHIGHASQERFARDGGRVWAEFVAAKAQEWEDMNTDWLTNFPGPLLVLSYTALREEVEAQLRRTLDFLGVSVTREQMECAMAHKEGIYRRPGARRVVPPMGAQEEAMLGERWARVRELMKAREVKEVREVGEVRER